MKKASVAGVLGWAIPLVAVGLLLSCLLWGGCGGSCCNEVRVPLTAVVPGCYQGTYSGDDSGTWQAAVASNGKVEVDIDSNQVGVFGGVGTFDTDGTFHATAGTAGFDTTWAGTFYEVGSAIKGNGTWTSTLGGQGTWKGQRVSDTCP